jgi:hypothetical protein
MKAGPIVLFGASLVGLALVRVFVPASLHFPPWDGGSGPWPAAVSEGLEVKLAMQVLISLMALGASLFMVLAKRYAPKEKHWAYGTIGTIIGFWLKG